MKHALDTISRWLMTALALLLILMVLMICLGVALRYIWGVTLLWLDESLVFSMVGIVFIGAIGVSQKNQHLRMSLLSDSFSKPLRRFLGPVEHLATAGVCLYVAWYSYSAISRLFARGTLSNMAEVPLWLVQGTVLVGLVGMALIAVFRLFESLRGSE
ncbi:TRAP transporter small permease [uncultured Martelella sp.]|uniref:TRAP transporter small permease n=1 Tax=uncultured Martelella sp. TaxID=392331 RepID=UPI0029C936BE|nr:TRAP transporter small permease [uncultured Martelella sp.]